MHKTVIFITHDLDEALRLGDRIAIMKDGNIEQIGTSENILTHPANKYVKRFVQDVDRTKIITASAIMEKSKAIILSKDGPKSAVRLMKDEGISSIYVTDKYRKLKGIVRIDDTIELVEQRVSNIESILITEVPTTSPDTSISDLLSVAKDAVYPIAVVDEDHIMLGIIKRSTIIAGIAREED